MNQIVILPYIVLFYFPINSKQWLLGYCCSKRVVQLFYKFISLLDNFIFNNEKLLTFLPL